MMPDAATLAVLKDLASLAVMLLALGIAVYSVLRLIFPTTAWNHRGLVAARPYAIVDVWVIIVSAAALLYMQQHSPVASPPSSVDAAREVRNAAADFSGLLLNIVFLLTLCVGLLMYLSALRGLNPAELFGLRLVAVGRAAVLALALIVPIYIIVGLVANSMYEVVLKDLWPNLNPQDNVRAFQATDSIAVKLLMGVAAVVVAPIVEETMFRGFLYGVLKRYTDGYFAAMCSALLFAIVHMHVGSVVPLFVLALGFCLAYELTGCLLVPMFMHAFFNGASIVFLMILSD